MQGVDVDPFVDEDGATLGSHLRSQNGGMDRVRQLWVDSVFRQIEKSEKT